MNARPLLTALALCLGNAGCGSSDNGLSRADVSGNACTSDLDCGDGRCVAKICEASGNHIDSFMVEVTLPVGVNSGEYGQVRYLRQQATNASGVLDIELDVVADLSVAIAAPSQDCAIEGADVTGNIPIHVTAYEDSGIKGIFAATLDAESDPARSDRPDGNAVTVSLAPGTVDLYIVPVGATGAAGDAEATAACKLAPMLARDQVIAPGTVSLKQALSPAELLNVDVQIPAVEAADSPLSGWVLDMVEPSKGLRVSTQEVLLPELDANKIWHHRVTLGYHAIVGSQGQKLAGNELFRLSSNDAVMTPTYYVARSAVDLFGSRDLVLNQIQKLPNVVTLRGTVESEFDATPVRASIVAIRQSSDNMSTGAIASFQTKTTAATDGQFELQLLAGDYNVVVLPNGNSPLASASLNWSVAPSPAVQDGKLIRLAQQESITVVVRGGAGDTPIADATISATPTSAGARTTFLDNLLGYGVTSGARSQTAIANSTGVFELPVDPGRYDITVKPMAGSGFPWAVHTGTLVESRTASLYVQVRNPVAYSGIVTVPGKSADSDRRPLSGAVLRFFALLDSSGQVAKPGSEAASALEIGETRTAEDGGYRVLLPDQLD